MAPPRRNCSGGLALILAGAGFKLAAVPFHLWTPDVFEAAPAPVTAFVATVSKAAVLAGLVVVLGVYPGPLLQLIQQTFGH